MAAWYNSDTMPIGTLPVLTPDGSLPPGIHAAALTEVIARFGMDSSVREQQAHLLQLLVEAAKSYRTIKRILLWGSFVTDKLAPADLDYSIVVSALHGETQLDQAHRRFFNPREARIHYGADRGFLIVPDYPVEKYAELLDFLCHTRRRTVTGIVEINLRGEVTETDHDSE